MANQTSNQPTYKHPFGTAQTRLFKYILAHPGCTMNEIREDEFPDKNGKYVYNLLHENAYYIEKREIGTDFPAEYRIYMDRFKTVVDIPIYIKTGRLVQKLVQTTLDI